MADLPARLVLLELLERALPGRGTRIKRLRDELVDFSTSLSAKTLLLRGPIGSGKSTIARLVGLLRRVAPLQRTAAERYVRDMRFEGPNRVDLRLIPWFVELALTGLVETLAEAQLFGVTRGAYTGAERQRAGVFEEASTGRVGRGKEPPAGARLTGGIVFLDEVGDLSATLQAKLLPVLAGGAFYRIGGEGNTEHELTFRGATIAASWKELDGGRLRPDLLSRLSSHVIDVPGIDERADDFGLLLDEVERTVLERIRHEIETALVAESELDREHWRARLDDLSPIGRSARRELAKVDWAQHGNLRGLAFALDLIHSSGRPVGQVIERLPIVPSSEGQLDPYGLPLLQRAMARKSIGLGLAGHLRTIELEQRRMLRDALLRDRPSRQYLAENLGLSEEQLESQIHQLGRSRRRGGEDAT